MNAQPIVARLERFPAVLQSVVAMGSVEDARFKPAAGGWSILEIVCHLVDEETDDFRARLAFILDRKTGAWPPIDPEGWARERRYHEQDLPAVLARFAAERARSVAWLRARLVTADWALAYVHPKFGPLRAGDLLASWAAHDVLHLRQIAKRYWELAAQDAGSTFSTAYAGELKA